MSLISAELRTLSTEELFTEVRSLEPRSAVFDCDGTLWSGDAGSSFMRWSIETGCVSAEVVRWIEDRYQGYLQGDVSELVICGEMVQMYEGIPVSQMREAAREFFARSIEPNIFPEMLTLVTELQASEVDLWAVSSTNDWVIEEGMKHFGIPAERVLAASVHPEGDRVGRALRDVPTDEGKAVALRRVGLPAPDAVFGNSVHDAAMLAMARRAFPVNPTPALVERSMAEGWPIYLPRAVDSSNTPD